MYHASPPVPTTAILNDFLMKGRDSVLTAEEAGLLDISDSGEGAKTP